MNINHDLQIARQAKLKPITEIGARLGVPEDQLECYGRHKAKKIGRAWFKERGEN